MGVFNISFLKPGASKGGGGGYGILVDELSILENRLAGDGNLSPGDYDLLLQKARELQVHPGLTADQRSNIAVKVSSYEKQKSVSQVNDGSDIARIRRTTEDDVRQATMRLANNPQAFLKSMVDAKRLELDDLAKAIDQAELAGSDATSHYNAYNETFNELQENLSALERVEGYQSGSGSPIGDFVAFIDTNAEGEITKINIGRAASKQGYAETNALYGGMQIYGRINKKEAGENVFRLGATEYKGSDLLFQDPTSPGSFRAAPLTSGGGAGKFGTIDTYEDVDLNTISPQRFLRQGQYARGRDGNIYYSNPAGGYRKYLGVEPDQLGVREADLFNIPSTIEDSINAQSNETVDGSVITGPQSFPAPGLLDAQVESVTAGSPTAAVGPQSVPAGRPRTPEPTARAPRGALGVARDTINRARSFVGNLFG